jgi:hypothetical protein
MKSGDVGPHSPFHFQSAANHGGPSVFNGEGPMFGYQTYDNKFTIFSNVSIFYAIDGSMSDPAATSGNAVLLGLADGAVYLDNDHQDLVVRITTPNQK